MKLREIKDTTYELCNVFIVKNNNDIPYLGILYPSRLSEMFQENKDLIKYYDYEVITIHTAEFVDYVGKLDIYIQEQ